MKYIFTLIIGILSLSFLHAQINHLSLENTQVSWNYMPYDSAFIDADLKRNGANHLYLADRDAFLIDGNFLYTLFININEDDSGFYLVKLNYITGEVVWERTFDLRDDPNHISPSNIRFNEEGHLEIISFRRSQPLLGEFAKLWGYGTLARHIYNKDTGELLEYSFGIAENSNEGGAIELIKRWGFTHLDYKNNNYVYYVLGSLPVEYGGTGVNLYQLDSDGKRHNEIYPQFEIYWSNIYSTMVYQDTISILSYHENKENGTEFKSVFRTYNPNWELIDEVELQLPIPRPKSLSLSRVYDDVIEIIATYYELAIESGAEYKVIYIDKNDYSIKEVLNIPLSQNYGLAYTKLKDKSGAIFAKVELRSVGGQGRGFLKVFKSDGNGHLSIIKDSEILDLKGFSLGQIIELPNGNFILSGHIADITKKDGKTGKNAPGAGWILAGLDRSELGITTSTHDESLLPGFVIAPNPASSKLEILTYLDFNETRLYSLDGRLIKQIKGNDKTIDITSLYNGVYLCVLVKDGKIISQSEKLVKSDN